MDLLKNRYQELSRLLGAFSIALLQDFITFSRHCEREKISLDEIIGFIKYETSGGDIGQNRALSRTLSRELAVNELISEKYPRCPVCKKRLRLEEINNHDTRMIDDHSHSWWLCPDENCDHEPEMDDRFPPQIISDMGIITQKPIPTRNLRRARAASMKRCGEKRG